MGAADHMDLQYVACIEINPDTYKLSIGAY